MEAKYKKIGEVSEILGVEPHVIRYWCQRFRLQVKRRGGGHRFFTPGQVEVLRQIRDLRRAGHTIPQVARVIEVTPTRNPEWGKKRPAELIREENRKLKAANALLREDLARLQRYIEAAEGESYSAIETAIRLRKRARLMVEEIEQIRDLAIRNPARASLALVQAQEAMGAL